MPELNGSNTDGDNTSDQNKEMFQSVTPRRLWTTFRDRKEKAGRAQSLSYDMIQTPRKRPRTHTHSPFALNGPLEEVGDQPVDPEILDLINPILAELEEMREEMQEIRQDNKMLRERCLKLDSYSRRNNLKIWGLNEYDRETNFDIKRLTIELLNEYGIAVNTRDIGKIQRIGMRDRNNRRCVLVQFLHQEDKEQTVRMGKQMYMDYGIKLVDDFPPEIESRRNVLRPVMQAAARCTNDKGGKKYQAFLNVDKLTVNGRQYTVNNTQQLPADLKLENVYTPQKNGITAFFTANSPLSNHYLAKQRIEGKDYSSNEQYYMEQKARTFGNAAMAEQVLQEDDPKKQKTMCKIFDRLDQTAWDAKKLEVMKTGLKAKFEQNENLATFLKNTETNNILECNRADHFWGIGMSLRDPNVWKRNSWVKTAHNHLGTLLMELRTELKR